MPYFGFSATEFSREVHAACEKSSNSSCETSQGGRYYNDLMQQMKSGVALFGIAGLAIGYFLGKKL